MKWYDSNGVDVDAYPREAFYSERVAPMVVICAWCPDSKAKTAAATRAGRVTTHTICDACNARVMAEESVRDIARPGAKAVMDREFKANNPRFRQMKRDGVFGDARKTEEDGRD